MTKHFGKKAAVITMIFSLLLVAACGQSTGQSGNSSENNGSDSNESVTLTAMASATLSTAALEASISKVEELTGIKVKLDTYPDSEYITMLKTKLTTGDASDLIFHAYGVYDIPSDYLEPLDGHWVENITDATRANTVWKDNVVKAPYGGQSNMGLLYNKKVLEDAGITLPLKNYSELTAALDAIKQQGVTPLYLPNKENWTAQILFLASMTGVLINQPGLVDDLANNRATPQEVPEIVKLWENAHSLIESGYLNEDFMSADLQMGYEALANGSAAFMPGADWFYSDIAANFSEQLADIGMTVTPLWDEEQDGYVMTNPSNAYISIPSNSKQKEAAQTFIDTFLSEDSLTAFYEIQPGAVPYENLGYELNLNAWNQEMLEYASEFNTFGDWTNNSYDGIPKLNPLFGDFNLHAQNLFAGKTPEEALTDWYKKYATDAKAKKLTGFE